MLPISRFTFNDRNNINTSAFILHSSSFADPTQRVLFHRQHSNAFAFQTTSAFQTNYYEPANNTFLTVTGSAELACCCGLALRMGRPESAHNLAAAAVKSWSGVRRQSRVDKPPPPPSLR